MLVGFLIISFILWYHVLIYSIHELRYLRIWIGYLVWKVSFILQYCCLLLDHQFIAADSSDLVTHNFHVKVKPPPSFCPKQEVCLARSFFCFGVEITCLFLGGKGWYGYLTPVYIRNMTGQTPGQANGSRVWCLYACTSARLINW